MKIVTSGGGIVIAMLIAVFVGAGRSKAGEIPANDPKIQYFGRWDFSNPLSPRHSWPGVSLRARFEGTSIGIRMNDTYCYYNVTIDDTLTSVFHQTSTAPAFTMLASGLSNAETGHTIRISKRNESAWTSFSFEGFVLDSGKTLLEPEAMSERKIEFIGDSYTSALGNEWADTCAAPDAQRYTNIDQGFAALTARHYNAQFHSTSQSGLGLVCDFESNFSNTLPEKFGRTLCSSDSIHWNFRRWIPQLVVVCLGLNDYTAFGGYDAKVSRERTAMFKSRYHQFLEHIRQTYPHVKMLALAAHVDWVRKTVSAIVDEERKIGNADVFFGTFPEFDEEDYVNGGHPSVGTHQKITEYLIESIDAMHVW